MLEVIERDVRKLPGRAPLRVQLPNREENAQDNRDDVKSVYSHGSAGLRP